MPRTKVRLNLQLSTDVRSRLEDLRIRIGADSLTEVARRALALYDALLTRGHGMKLLLRAEDGREVEVLLPESVCVIVPKGLRTKDDRTKEIQ